MKENSPCKIIKFLLGFVCALSKVKGVIRFMEIYMLEYYKEIDHGDFETEEYNLIGLYLSEEEAQNVKKRAILEMNIDEELLYVSSTEIGELQWEGGFVSSDDIYQDSIILTACFNKWLGIDKSPEESWEDDEYYNALCDVEEVAYRIKNIRELAEYIQQVWIKRFNDKDRSLEDYMQIAGNIISTMNE